MSSEDRVSASSQTGSYTPGVCNIGKEEVKIRKKRLVVSFIAVIVFTYLSFDRADSSWMKVFLFISSFACVLIYIEVRRKFCVIFGLAGYFNFGKPGKTEKVTNKDFLVKDRQRVLRIILASFLCALLYMLLVSFLSRMMR